jgi:hypothetical protein
MAEHAQRGFEPQATRGQPVQAQSGVRHEALKGRGDAREAGYSALLNKRPPGPRPPALRKFIEMPPPSGRTTELPNADPPSTSPSATQPIQMVMQYGNRQILSAGALSFPIHYAYDDSRLRKSLHLTIADVQAHASRTWESRQWYTPTGLLSGYWTPWIDLRHTTPAAAQEAAGESGRAQAETGFHADAKIQTLLSAKYPPAPVAPAHMLDPSAPAFIMPASAAAPVRRLRASAPAFVMAPAAASASSSASALLPKSAN